MVIDFIHFTPELSLAGGMLIGLAATVLILCNGRIAGISGILGGLLRLPAKDVSWRVAFLIGLIGAPIAANLLGKPVVVNIEARWDVILIAGFLVGIGSRFAGGCTSGHGVCGLSRGSFRSLIATVIFMAAGLVTVYLQQHILVN